MKRCYFCKTEKPVSEFNKDKSRRDGLQNRCRSCHLKANREWAHRHPDVRRISQKRRYEREALLGGRQSKEASAYKRRAHRLVALAVSRGELARPSHCQICGTADFPIHGHHEDYKKPLDVIWLCAPCHGQLHARRSA